MGMRLWTKIVLCVLLAEILGGLGGIVTAGSVGDWYATLQRPPGTPPNAVFGPVWGALYALIGLSFALVWHYAPAGPRKLRAFALFAAQAVLNLAWTPVFFGAHRLGLSLAVILALLVAIALTLRAFGRLHRPAGWLLVPYGLWVAYASYLNAGFFFLNR
jgi:benzodiazapine receptor